MSFSKAHFLPYNQLTTLCIQALVLLKFAYFQENVTTTSVPLATNIHRNNTSDFDNVSPKLYEMEMDIWANNYSFQCFLCFLKLKLHPSFLLTTINHKRCTLSHNFSHNRKIYLIRKLLTKFRFKTRFYTQTLVKWSWHSNVSHTES